MKVLMTTDAVGGVWGYSLGLAEALRTHGTELLLATMGPPPRPAQRQAAARAGVAGLEDGGFQLEWMDDPWDDVEAAGDWLLGLAHDNDVDLVHLNGFAHGALPWQRPVVCVGHSCVLSWWQAVKGEPAPRRLRRYAEAARAGLGAASAVVAPTRAMLRALEAHYGIRDGLVIANGSPAPLHSSGQRRPFVLAAGRFWDEAKNLSALDAAACDIPWQVVAAGDGAPGRHVHWLGQLPAGELWAIMRTASVFAAPARYEPFGLAPLEAARAGCALVLGDIPSLREVWGDAALYVDPAEPAALRRAIVALMDDRRLRDAMAACAQERSKLYTLEAMAAGYAKLYRRVATERKVPA